MKFQNFFGSFHLRLCVHLAHLRGDPPRQGGGVRPVEAGIARYSVPEQLRSDNGAEFIVQDWLKAQEIKTLYIKPGSSWENGHIESFHDKLRDECLNVELFWSVEDARTKLEKWRVDYNVHRPHSSLANLPPAAFANELRQRKPTTNR